MQNLTTPQNNVRNFLSSGIGNTIEIFDFTLYGVFVPILSTLFFPSDDPAVAFLQAITLYGAGFLMRPLGGLFFGHLGDRKGRKVALSTSILMMTVATGFIGFLPSYESIGISSTILLVLCRLFQGFSVGGEYIGASIFLVEHTNTQKGFSSSIIASAGAIGSLLGTGMGAIILTHFDFEGAWRLPFLFSMGLGAIGFYVRCYLDETPSFVNKTHTEKVPLLTVLHQFPREFLTIILMGATQVTLAYGIFVYQGVYFTHYMKFLPQEALILGGFGILIYVLLVPFFGWKSDKFGYDKTLKFSLMYLVVALYPIYSLFQLHDFTFSLLGQLLLAIGVAGFCAPATAFMTQLLPPPVRYTGVGFGYSLGGAFIGGVMPTICAFLIEQTNDTLMPMYYELACVFIALMVLCYKPYSKISTEHDKLAFSS